MLLKIVVMLASSSASSTLRWGGLGCALFSALYDQLSVTCVYKMCMTYFGSSGNSVGYSGNTLRIARVGDRHYRDNFFLFFVCYAVGNYSAERRFGRIFIIHLFMAVSIFPVLIRGMIYVARFANISASSLPAIPALCET